MSGEPRQDPPEQFTFPTNASPSLALACLTLYLAVVLGLFVTILHRNNGVFTYSLDDPYIHLALAQNLAHGHYGINPGEPSSPSSSIVWPFLLVPFATHPWGVYVPLLWNVLFCGLAAALIGRTVQRWRWRTDPGPARSEFPARFLIAIALMLVANLVGLTFVGMEHGLQVLLATACAAGLAEAFAGRPMPAWCLWAAVLGPAVRYENFAIVAAVAIALCGLRRYRAAVAVALLSLVAPILFSLFLISLGLPALPSSVLVKAMVYSFHRSFLVTAAATMIRSTYWGIHEVAWWDQLLVGCLLLFLTLREKRRGPRFILASATFASLLQLCIGRFNWFYRYEVYALIFTVMLAFTALAESFPLRRMTLTAGALALGMPYVIALGLTPDASADVYQQQYQTHRFLAGFEGPAVAVNDLGLVSYSHPPGLYVLDLWGLASPEASRRVFKDNAWLDQITVAHHAGLAILYPDWYPQGAPDDWTPLATMCITSRRASISRKCVVFYSTPMGDQAALASELAAFARTLPPEVKMTLGRDSTQQDDAP